MMIENHAKGKIAWPNNGRVQWPSLSISKAENRSGRCQRQNEQ